MRWRLASIPGLGALSVTAFAVTTPDVGNFSSAWNHAAWLVLAPKQHVTCGTPRSGGISRMDHRYIRRLPYPGTRAIAVALATCMARSIFARLCDGTSYRPQVRDTPAMRALRRKRMAQRDVMVN
ncbi:MAG: transposase [Roseinatronobacter sp.]